MLFIRVDVTVIHSIKRGYQLYLLQTLLCECITAVSWNMVLLIRRTAQKTYTQFYFQHNTQIATSPFWLYPFIVTIIWIRSVTQRSTSLMLQHCCWQLSNCLVINCSSGYYKVLSKVLIELRSCVPSACVMTRFFTWWHVIHDGQHIIS